MVILLAGSWIAPQGTDAHLGWPNTHWREHPFSTKFDYYIPYCFEDGWPNGSQGTSANNVAYGVNRWNDHIVSGREIDFRYGRMVNCADRNDEDMVVRMRDLPNGTVGRFGFFFPVDQEASGHLLSGSLFVDNNTGNVHQIFYGGQPVWQGFNDARIHVQQIAAHEAGHGAILAGDYNDNETCCEGDLEPTNVNWHSVYSADVMLQYVQTGEAHGPTPREIGWLDLSYPDVD